MTQPARPEGSAARFVVGIDLGTTNSAVAYVDAREADWAVRIFPVVQFVAPGETEAREILPSFHYTPAAGEFASLKLPWDEGEAKHVVGVFARDHGASVPGRLVFSAKSWLSHSGVDRTANLLPWHGAPDVEKISPMEASARYLAHIRAAWNHHWPEFPLEQQEIAITIPASSDEIARELTVAAARRAGLPRIVLLEEPQAAFYAWVHKHARDWSQRVQAGQVILVCDIGGGTTDFTLIQVQPGEWGGVRFHRFAVGEHLILGGDNLDLALAHFVEERLTGGGKLEPRQWSVLVRRCQQAKEALLGASAPERWTLHVPSAGSKLIGGSRSFEIDRAEVVDLLVNGFLPFVRLDEQPAKRQSGFQEFGLPYAPDHAITRYLAAFLTAHRDALGERAGTVDERAVRPDVILFNGGLFESPQMRTRLLDVLRSWFRGREDSAWSPVVLENERLDLAVAVGAAYYGMVRRGQAVRISGGLARSYYIGVRQGDQTAALCLVPAGIEEGQEVRLEPRLQLRIREPVEFPLYVSSARTNDRPGDLVPVDPEQLTALPPIRTVLRAGKSSAEAQTVPVQLHARLTEIGTLDVWCAEAEGPRTWKLQFDVRSATQTDATAHLGTGERAGVVDEETVSKCAELIRRTFAARPDRVAPEELVKRLEAETGMPRLDWPPSLLRKLWEELMSWEEARKRSAAHEARWLNLLGFSLRPGYGVAVDDWRVAQTWKIGKVHHSANELCRAEWWILWRRISGGLVAGQQRTLANPLIAALRARARAEKAGSTPGRGKPGGTVDFKFGPHKTQEVWRLLGSLEWIEETAKIELGELLLEQIGRKGPRLWGGAGLWALARLGARVPAYGPLNAVVPADIVAHWARTMLGWLETNAEFWFALMQLTRRTGDRYRDVPEDLRAAVLARMAQADVPAHYRTLVAEGGQLERQEQELIFGEALPPGLRLN